MAVRLVLTLRSTLAQDLAAAVDAGSGPGILRCYTGGQPATANAAATGTLLLEFTLNDPAFTEDFGALTLDNTGVSTAALADGTVGYARFLDSDANAVLDLAAADGIVLSDTTLETGQPVDVDACAISFPAA